ncbi:MAG: hypothetical protein JXB04_03455 [Kiritimatiellae bacterium]|nr:hypothetical protein [Kiritimatiellia bacterium]
MSIRGTRRDGFTALELLISVGLLVMSIAAAVAGWLYVVQGERMNSIQMELDIDVRSAMQWVKTDLRLSSMDQIFFYPEGAGPYTGISMPLPVEDEYHRIELDTNGMIVWGQTAIYHVWESIPNELRVTTFYNRDPTLTPEQRQAQINSVVASGDASGTPYETGAGCSNSTMAIFKNLFHWSLAPQGGVVDCYSDQFGVRRSYALGSVILDPGSHTFRFTAFGTNAASTGLKFGLDDVVVSPCGIAREAEAQQILSGGCVPEYRAGGTWGGNYDLAFSPGGVGDYFELRMENDRWEETDFKHSACQRMNTKVEFDESITPYMDYVARLEGGGSDTNWFAFEQTGSLWDSYIMGGDIIAGCAVRVLLRGGDMLDGGYIHHNGGNVEFRFDAGNQSLKIIAANIMECASNDVPCPDGTGTIMPLYFDSGTSAGTLINAGQANWARPWNNQFFPIDKDRSYLITYLVSGGAGNGAPEYWIQSSTNTPGCYIIPAASNPSALPWAGHTWSNLPYTISDRLYAIKFARTSYATNGTFTSQIADTHLPAPAYTEVSWNALLPIGANLGLRVRSGDQPDLSDAPAWSNITAFMSTPAVLSSLPSKRYVQWQAEFWPFNSPDYALAKTPRLQDVTVRWTGETRLTDLGASLTTGPAYGVYKVTVDDKELVRGVVVDLEIYEDVSGFGGKTKRLTSAMRAVEIEPRNTGK